MEHAYMGIDVGSISTKGVIMTRDNTILSSAYIWTEGNPIGAVKKLLELLQKDFDETKFTGNFQAAARDARYDFFKEVCEERKLDEVLVAHQKDDLIETYLIRRLLLRPQTIQYDQGREGSSSFVKLYQAGSFNVL